MASLNKVQLIGNLGKDPETRYMTSGEAITSLTLATTENWKDKSTGESKPVTEWHRCVFFGRLAEVAGQYLSKGSTIYVEGKLQTRKWTDKENIERYTTEIKVDNMQMLSKSDGGRAAPAQAAAPSKTPAPASRAQQDEEPF